LNIKWITILKLIQSKALLSVPGHERRLSRSGLSWFYCTALLWSIITIGVLLSYNAYAVADDAVAHKVAKPAKTHFAIAVGQNSYPYQFANDEGEPDGLLVDIWKLWAQKNGYTVTFKLNTWSGSLAQLESAQVDFHAGMAITQTRLKNFLLGQAFVSAQTSVFVHQQLSGIHSLTDLAPYVVGAVAGSSHITALTKQLPGIKFKIYSGPSQLYQAALDGSVKIFTGLNRIRATHPDFKQLSQQFPLYKKISGQSFDLSYAVKKGQGGLHRQIQQGLNQVFTNDIKLLERRWLGVDADTDTIVIAMPVDMAPYMSISARGEPIGLFVDVWRKWAETTQQKIVFLTDNSPLSMQNLMSKKADVHAAYADDAVNANLFAHAHHIYSFFSKIYYPRETPAAVLTAKSVDNAKLGILASNPVKKALLKRFNNVELVLFSTREAMIEASLSRKIDGFVAAQEIINVHLIKRNLQSYFSGVQGIRFESKAYSLVSKENIKLISTIKEGFSQIAINDLTAMESAWIEHSESPYFATVKTKVNFNPSEKNWLLRHPVIRLGALRDWAPIEFTDDNGQLIGVTADLMKIIERRADVTIQVQLYDQWSQVLRALQSKDIDMIASMEKTVDRKGFAVFTEGYWPSHWALILPSGSSHINTVEQLKGKRLAIIKGYQLIPYLHQHFPQTLLQIVKDNKSGFEAIRQGRADAFIDGMVTAASELKSGDYRDFSFALLEDIDPSMERLGIRGDWQPLVGILNKVIANITADEKKQILENWFEIKIENGIDKEKVLKIGAVAVVIFILILIWNRQLQAQIRLRQAMELKMKYMATHDELTGLPNRTLLRDRLNSAIASHARHQEHLALLFIDLDGFKAVNDTYGHYIGDELLSQMAQRFKQGIRKSDTAARCGGDEFVILLTGLHHREEAAFICEKILNLVKHPFVLSTCSTHVGASIGVAMYPQDGTVDEQLLKVGDTLMYQVKTSGKNNYRFSELSRMAD
jgi:diguanylate cyclase (GGDEF)-like protein